MRPRSFTSYAACCTLSRVMMCSCRICSNVVDAKHSLALFSRDAVKDGFPDRVSTVINLPVTENDGLPKHMCRPCNRRLTNRTRSLQTVRDGCKPYAIASWSAITRVVSRDYTEKYNGKIFECERIPQILGNGQRSPLQ